MCVLSVLCVYDSVSVYLLELALRVLLEHVTDLLGPRDDGALQQRDPFDTHKKTDKAGGQREDPFHTKTTGQSRPSLHSLLFSR